jgi:thioredoxin 1
MKLSPIVDSIAGQFAGRVKVGKLNVHENMETAGQFRIFSIPRVYVFKGGTQPVIQLTGLQSEANLVKTLNEVLAT